MSLIDKQFSSFTEQMIALSDDQTYIDNMSSFVARQSEDSNQVLSIFTDVISHLGDNTLQDTLDEFSQRVSIYGIDPSNEGVCLFNTPNHTIYTWNELIIAVYSQLDASDEALIVKDGITKGVDEILETYSSSISIWESVSYFMEYIKTKMNAQIFDLSVSDISSFLNLKCGELSEEARAYISGIIDGLDSVADLSSARQYITAIANMLGTNNDIQTFYPPDNNMSDISGVSAWSAFSIDVRSALSSLKTTLRKVGNIIEVGIAKLSGITIDSIRRLNASISGNLDSFQVNKDYSNGEFRDFGMHITLTWGQVTNSENARNLFSGFFRGMYNNHLYENPDASTYTGKVKSNTLYKVQYPFATYFFYYESNTQVDVLNKDAFATLQDTGVWHIVKFIRPLSISEFLQALRTTPGANWYPNLYTLRVHFNDNDFKTEQDPAYLLVKKRSWIEDIKNTWISWFHPHDATEPANIATAQYGINTIYPYDFFVFTEYVDIDDPTIPHDALDALGNRIKYLIDFACSLPNNTPIENDLEMIQSVALSSMLDIMYQFMICNASADTDSWPTDLPQWQYDGWKIFYSAPIEYESRYNALSLWNSFASPSLSTDSLTSTDWYSNFWWSFMPSVASMVKNMVTAGGIITPITTDPVSPDPQSISFEHYVYKMWSQGTNKNLALLLQQDINDRYYLDLNYMPFYYYPNVFNVKGIGAAYYIQRSINSLLFSWLLPLFNFNKFINGVIYYPYSKVRSYGNGSYQVMTDSTLSKNALIALGAATAAVAISVFQISKLAVKRSIFANDQLLGAVGRANTVNICNGDSASIKQLRRINLKGKILTAIQRGLNGLSKFASNASTKLLKNSIEATKTAIVTTIKGTDVSQDVQSEVGTITLDTICDKLNDIIYLITGERPN